MHVAQRSSSDARHSTAMTGRTVAGRSRVAGAWRAMVGHGMAWLLIGLLGGTMLCADEQPNVVMIISDDQAWTDFGFMGHPVIQTPRLDALARDGLVFTHGYVPSSLCRPSLASIITGLYPHQHGLTSNDPPLPRGPEFAALRQQMIDKIDALPTLPRILKQHGYASMQTGKWWEGNFARGGFTHGMTHGDPQRGGRHGDDGLAIGREGMEPILRFLDEVGEQPFFLWYAPLMPHSPHTPPDRLVEKYTPHSESPHVARYWAMCEWFDETVGTLLDALRVRHMEHKTLVVFVTDNGWIQSTDNPRYAARSKRSPYDGGLRTPIILRWPGVIAPSISMSHVSSIDLVPTILQACGVPAPQPLPGINLLDARARSARTAIYGEIFSHNAVDIHDPLANLQFRWIRRGPWKMIVRQDGPALAGDEGNHLATTGAPRELYQLDVDPYEQSNLAELRPEEVAMLSDLLRSWWPEAEAQANRLAE